ncbi:xanthine dehydrogenase family protein molybdopterin-binding subunit [Ferruginivarius sediminum]|uniref:Xanthine dehydrogenase family protein molybdopterin-binding subunit n=1 Tax=Ferruginivarius sediminum TaxID=2661937 RepID=A0A369T5L3_9PROT|nr:xanthine dehydrogenase family protein molybdopterin-binding subunit [Ferruginivarius sediminum]RDD60620.1 xanthine dehydrogenase family protein molybdopterin-binding subunit [Ferruginivarius sediminum]
MSKAEESADVAASVAEQPFIGQRLPRKEDRRFVIGKGRFTDDISVPGMLHAAFVRSPHAHARIRSIDTEAALKLPGVVAVITGRELAEFTSPFVCQQEGAAPMEMDALPVDKARFAGDPVACVVAVDRYVAEDGVDLVEVDWDALPPVLDMHHASDPGVPLVDEKIPSNLHTRETHRYGDIDGAFARADRVVKAEFRSQRLTHVPIETRSVVATWDEGREELTYYGAAQTAHILRTTLADRLGLSENQVRVVSPDVGGGFGLKLPLFREEFTVAAMAMRLKRPIKWVEDRLENLTASNHARDDAVSVEVAVLNDGTVLGVRANLWADFGAYAFYPPSYIINVIGWLLLGAYKIDNYEYTVNVAITNKCPAGTLRAPMAIVTWASDGMMHRVAEELGLDPFELRRKNMLSLDDQPYQSAPGYPYEALTLREGFDETLAKFDIDAFRREQADAAEKGRLIGVGIASVVEPTTYGSAWYKASGDDGSGHEAATVKLEPTGAINVTAGIVGTGQGYETSLAQVVADALGSSPANVDVRLGDTYIAPYGMGSRGSRGAAAGHGVAYLAAMDLREKVLGIGAHLLQRPAESLKIVNDEVVTRSDVGVSVPVREIARIAYNDPTSLPDGMLPGLEAHRTYDPPFMTFSNATHLCQVEVDAETGGVTIVKYRVHEDAGTLINPMIVDGQVHGGVSMGIGQVLLEETRYDEQGMNVSATLADYLMPTMDTVPMIEVEHLETPNPNTPQGIKGMAEGPVQGAVASVALAVQDAVARSGGRLEQLPFTPSRLLGVLRASRSG